MLSLNTFQNGMTEFDEIILATTIIEINSLIKQNATDFRFLIEFEATTIEDKIFKNGIIHYYLHRGYKIVAYPTFIYIDWGRINVYQELDRHITKVSDLGNHFDAPAIYLALTSNKDLRKVSFRSLQHLVDREVKAMNIEWRTVGVISVDLATTMDGATLNKMFAPDLALYSRKHPDTHLTFLTGGCLQISLGIPTEFYTDIPVEVLFGAKNI